jgi:hypothetical protein
LKEDSSKIKSWVGYEISSNHLPILLQVENEDWKAPIPFKLNHTWLIEEEFRVLITRTWKPFDRNIEDTTIKQFADNLKRVTEVETEWARKHAQKNKKDLKQVEEGIKSLFEKQ